MEEEIKAEALRALVRGRVQGVYFRAFVAERARPLGLLGYVRNLPDGRTVEVWAEGSRDKLESLLRHLHSGPPGAWVEKVDYQWLEPGGGFQRFEIR